MIRNVGGFIAYFEGIRRRTINYIRTLPSDRVDWAPRESEFTCGDIIRHLTFGESMFVGAVVDGRWKYAGHARGDKGDLDFLLAQMDSVHAAAMEHLRTLPDADLDRPRSTLDGPDVKAWRLLMAMVEHEIHHRSQLAMYLTMVGIKPPHIYGLGVEDVIARATG